MSRIVRGHLKFEDHFTTVPNAWMRDTRLSFKARGLLANLLSHKEGWSVTVESLAATSADGKDAVRSGIKELESGGYLQRIERTRDDQGRLGDAQWVLQEPAESPMAGFPPLGNPPTDNPPTGNPPLKEEHPSEDYSSELAPLPGLESVPAARESKPDPMAGFDEFWEAYPRKKSKIAAAKAWPKAVKAAGGVEAIMIGAARERDMVDRKLKNLTYVPYPASWLNDGAWDEYGNGLSYPTPSLQPERFPVDHRVNAPKFDHSQQRTAISQLTADEIAQLSAMGEAIGRPPFELFTEAEAADMIRNRKDPK